MDAPGLIPDRQPPLPPEDRETPAGRVAPGDRVPAAGQTRAARITFGLLVVVAALLFAWVIWPFRAPLFLAAVLLSAVWGGIEASIFASILSVVVYDFFFTEPFYSLRMADPQDYLSLGTFLVVAALTSHLTARVRDQADTAQGCHGSAHQGDRCAGNAVGNPRRVVEQKCEEAR